MMKIKKPKINIPKINADVPSSITDRVWALEIAAGVFLSVVSVLIAAIA